MKALIFDTDVLIDVLRGNSNTLNQIKNLADYDEVSCSIISVAEIFAGMFPQEENKTKVFLDAIDHIGLTFEVAELAGKLKFQTKSHTLWLDDCLIAATALANQLVLVTKNVKHYPFKDLEKIKID